MSRNPLDFPYRFLKKKAAQNVFKKQSLKPWQERMTKQQQQQMQDKEQEAKLPDGRYDFNMRGSNDLNMAVIACYTYSIWLPVYSGQMSRT